MDRTYLFFIVLNFVLPGIPFWIGVFRWKKIDERYYPIIVIMGVAFFNELFRFFQLFNYVAKLGWPLGLSLMGYNLYVLIISILYVMLFRNMGVFAKRKTLMRVILTSFVLFWVTDHFLIPEHSIHGTTKYFRIFYSFVLSLLAIQKINMLLVTEKRNLLRNPAFLICICMLFYFLPYIITECITLLIKTVTIDFQQAVYKYRKIANIVIYLIYTLAVIWIPPKRQFIQLS
jgi:hypothetical protein